MVKVVGADSGSADGTGEVASSAALDAASAVYADGQPPIKPLPARVGPVSDMTVSRPQSCKHAPVAILLISGGVCAFGLD